jgi:hypothetical protein
MKRRKIYGIISLICFLIGIIILVISIRESRAEASTEAFNSYFSFDGFIYTHQGIDELTRTLQRQMKEAGFEVDTVDGFEYSYSYLCRGDDGQDIEAQVNFERFDTGVISVTIEFWGNAEDLNNGIKFGRIINLLKRIAP